MYAGHCHHYSGTVPLIWNPRTKLVSPQFHVVFDERFETVSAQPIAENNADQERLLERLFADSRWSYDDFYPVEQRYFFDSLWERTQPKQHQSERTPNTPQQRQRRSGMAPVREGATPKRVTIGTQTDSPPNATELIDVDQCEDESLQYSAGSKETLQTTTTSNSDDASDINAPSEPTPNKPTLTSTEKALSTDDRHKIAIVTQMASLSDPIYALNTVLYSKAQGIQGTTMSIPRGPRTVATQTNDPDQALEHAVTAFLAQSDPSQNELDPEAYIATMLHGYSVTDSPDQDVSFLNDLEPFVFSAIGVDNDVLTQSQMLRAPDKAQFLKAQESEISGLETKGVFEYVCTNYASRYIVRSAPVRSILRQSKMSPRKSGERHSSISLVHQGQGPHS